MKNQILATVALLTCTLLLVSCSKDDSSSNSDEMANTKIGAKASFTDGRLNEDITILKFLINVEDFELEFDDDFGNDDDGGSSGNYFRDIELEGPFILDLSNPNIVFPITNVDIPIGQYEELEFDIKKSKNSSSPLFQKSILIEGTISETPFIFWHNFEEEVEVDFDDSNIDITIESNGDAIVINFDLSLLFNSNSINFNQAQDGNNDGLIEISPNDPDGNNSLANQIKEKIKDIINLLDD